MPHSPSSTGRYPQRSALAAALAPARRLPPTLFTALALLASGLDAQQPPTPPPTPVAAYRAPTIALVQPAGGGTVPQDKPIVVFRFAQGEPADPIDARSFSVSVDGEDRTALFQVALQVAGGEAWGPLAADPGAIIPGAHHVSARVCSSRGACASVSASLGVLPSASSSDTTAAARSASGRAKGLDVILAVLKPLLVVLRLLLPPYFGSDPEL